ncbi:hypothetical protein A6U96_18015 [Agrobacterium tumefaciens]|uniref:Uncharacterized protein n=1 Tax=Agrobacterium tumefaciens TaxID=358 RepID=A0A2L2LJQ6_AGRTU|nr:hypothetical protein At1D1609_44160 [Agrobacterium tumefaciens]OCJ69499.1 hypothetical protein A6U96_18015 [Agrobacterium tumefaciens]
MQLAFDMRARFAANPYLAGIVAGQINAAVAAKVRSLRRDIVFVNHTLREKPLRRHYLATTLCAVSG